MWNGISATTFWEVWGPSTGWAQLWLLEDGRFVYRDPEASGPWEPPSLLLEVAAPTG